MYLFIEHNFLIPNGRDNTPRNTSSLYHSYSEHLIDQDGTNFILEYLALDFYNLVKRLFERESDKISISLVESKFCGPRDELRSNPRYFLGLVILDLREKDSKHKEISCIMEKFIREISSYGFVFSRPRSIGNVGLNELIRDTYGTNTHHYQTNTLIA